MLGGFDVVQDTT